MRPSPSLATLLLASLLLAAAPAQARFGKRSPPQSDTGAKRDAPHAATAPDEGAADEDDADEDDGERHGVSCGDCGGGALLLSLFTAPRHSRGHLHADIAVGATQGALPLSLTLGLEGLALPQAEGGGAAVRLALEGERWGVAFRALGLGLRTDDGSYGTDNIALLDAQLTYALVSLQRIRLRLEGGVHSAQAQDVSFLSPTVGASLEACVAGPLDFEARLQVVPFPDRVVDAQAGLALHLGPFGLHGGWRGLLLDDAGLVDGVRHADALGGPYLGASVVF
jgi:hypothetical protein